MFRLNRKDEERTMRIATVSVSRNFRIERNKEYIPHSLKLLLPDKTGRQYVIAAIRHLMQPYVDASFEVRGKLCKALIGASKDNNTFTIHVQERKEFGVGYTLPVCTVEITSTAGLYKFYPNEKSDHLFIQNLLAPPSSSPFFLRDYGKDHIFETDIRATLKKYMNTCSVRLFRGVFLFNDKSKEYIGLSQVFIPNIAHNANQGSVSLRSIALQNDEENKEQVCQTIADNLHGEINALSAKMEAPGPNIKRIETELADIESRAHMADELIETSRYDFGVWDTIEPLMTTACMNLEKLYEEKEKK
jgi:hypothetical protein